MPPDLALRGAAAERWKQHMMRGDFDAAWLESDLIASTGHQDAQLFWKGESWAGKRVMLRCLHGLGDAIQFIRYAPILRQTCRHLIVQSHPELVRLMACVPGVDQAVTWEEGEDSWDIQLEVTEMPRIFRTNIGSIPKQTPYLSPNPEMIAWAKRIIPEGAGLRVGLVWRASNWDQTRSMSASEIELLLDAKGCEFYILQKNADKTIDANDVQRWANDVIDTAALICRLHLVITVDTMTAHLAGALGCPTCLLLPTDADWRWMRMRTDSPWYPAMKLFRQNVPGSWGQPLEAVARELEDARAKFSSNSGSSMTSWLCV